MSDKQFNISLTCASYIRLMVYVDDIVITGNDSKGIAQLKQFHTKDLVKLRYFLSIEVARSRTCINLSKKKYVLDLLEETGLMSARPIEVPIDLNQK